MALFTYVANWKMVVSYASAERFYTEHGAALTQLAEKKQDMLILCPSFPTLGIFKTITHASPHFALGAQDCAPFPNGPYTGDVDALSLKQIGCTYCIVGHIERRTIHKETSELVAQKVAQLQLQKITPIVCIGENRTEYNAKTTLEILHAQLAPVLTVAQATQGDLFIAYEPVWAIGAGATSNPEEITVIIQALRTHVEKIVSKSVKILYGGGVTASNITTFRAIPGLDGVLIGSASTDFNSLQKIVS